MVIFFSFVFICYVLTTCYHRSLKNKAVRLVGTEIIIISIFCASLSYCSLWNMGHAQCFNWGELNGCLSKVSTGNVEIYDQ